MLPQDWRLTPSQARKRALWDGLSAAQKAAEIRKRKQTARRKRRRRRSGAHVGLMGRRGPLPYKRR